MKKNVMIIDDDAVSLECLACALKLYGFNVTSYESPDPAIHDYNPVETDIVITDYDLPGTTGIDVIREIHKKNKIAPVIVISGGMRKRIEMPCLRAGACAFFSKPLDITLLVSKLIAITGE